MPAVQRGHSGRTRYVPIIVLASLAMITAQPVTASARTPGGLFPQGSGAIWGVFSSRRGTATGMDVTRQIETKVGRRFNGLRNSTNMNVIMPTTWDRAVAARGAVDYHYFHPWRVTSTGGKICYPYAGIAAGNFDSLLTAQANSIRAWGYPILLTLTHEPEAKSAAQPSCGTAAEYRAAYNHVVHVFDNHGATNVTWVWTLIGSTFRGDHGGPLIWQPANYDIVGVDGYNKASFWRTPQQIFGAAEAFAVAHQKPLLIGEIGCEERPGYPSAKAAWISAAAAMVKSWPNTVGIMWSNTRVSQGTYYIDSSTNTFAAFKAAMTSGYFT